MGDSLKIKKIVITLVITLSVMSLCLAPGCSKSTGVPKARKPHIAAPKPAVWSSINRVVVIFLENTDINEAINQTFTKQLIQKGALLNQYFGITHPSQPNYIAFVAGQTYGVDSNDLYNLNAKHIGDLLEGAGKTWKSYAEAYPGNCSLAGQVDTYFRKHSPLISFKNIQNNPQRCANIVNGTQFKTDLLAHALPQFSLYIPDINNDGHDTGNGFADQWLSGFFAQALQVSNILDDTLFVITFDEGVSGGSNQIATILYGAGVKPGVSSEQDYDHYCLLKTIEGIFGLPDLGQYDASAPPIDDVWNNSTPVSATAPGSTSPGSTPSSTTPSSTPSSI